MTPHTMTRRRVLGSAIAAIAVALLVSDAGDAVVAWLSAVRVGLGR